MAKGQHVGGVSDALVGDPDLEAARSSQAALKRVMQPAGRAYRGGTDLGDADRCPLVPSHGRMFATQDRRRQVCIHQEHDGKPHGATATPSRWPLYGLAEAVEAYHSSSRAGEGSTATPEGRSPETTPAPSLALPELGELNLA